MTVDGLKVILTRVAAVSVRLAFWDEPFRVAEIVAVDVTATPVVAIVKFADVAPAGTVTVSGVVAGAPDALSVTVVPPVGEATPRVTVPVAELPPTTDAGLTVTEESVTAWIVSVAVCEVPLRLPLIVAEVLLVTVEVLTVNVAEVAPDGTVTLAGTFAYPLLEARVTTAPPVPAAPFNVTVPVAVFPPTTEVGATVRLESAGADIVRDAVLLKPANVPVMVAVTVDVTDVVEIENVAEVAPAATVTDAGTVALEELDVSVTIEPPGPAAPLRVTVPVEPAPPRTEAGDTDRLLIAAGVIVREAVWLEPFRVPLIAAVVEFETALVVMVKVVVVLPAGTVTVAGTVAEELPELSVTVVPPETAALLNVIVPVEVFPP